MLLNYGQIEKDYVENPLRDQFWSQVSVQDPAFDKYGESINVHTYKCRTKLIIFNIHMKIEISYKD